MCKRFLSALLALLLCLVLLPGCSEEIPTTVITTPTYSPADETTQPIDKDITPLLYKVTDESGNVVWLFGSIHVGKAYFYPLPDYVLSAFDGSDALAVELDILAFQSDLAAQTQLMSQMLYTDGTTIQDHIDPEIYDAAVQIMRESGMYMSVLDRYTPIIWYSYVESCATMQCGFDAALGIDMHLLTRAYEQKKEVLEVESAEFQYNMLASFSPELQEFLLENTVATCQHTELYKLGLDTMVSLWESGNEEAFSTYLSTTGFDFLSQEQQVLYAEFTDAMITQRNNDMTQYAVDALASGKEVFICVGAAHIVGEGAMAQQLQELGYTVEIVN